MFKFFDSLAHPTIDGLWINGTKGVSFQDYAAILDDSKILKGSVVCGLPNVGGYEAEVFFKASMSLSTIKPVVPIAPLESSRKIGDQFSKLKKIGYSGVKVHGRLLNQEYSHDFIQRVFSASEAHDMPILLCTFCYSHDSISTPRDLYKILVENLIKRPKTKIILVHAGVHDISLFYELARCRENVILDLSYTLNKYHLLYPQVFEFLVKNFDRKIFIGTDFPEYKALDVKHVMDPILLNAPKEKIENICFRNIENFFQIS